VSHESLAKDLLCALLAERGAEAEAEHEARSAAQRVDLAVSPLGPPPEGTPALLARMTAGPCAIELVSRAPDLDTVLGLARKQLNWAHARSGERSLWAGLAPMWLVAAGRPQRALTALRSRRLVGYPRGFHEVLPPVGPRIVSIPELPVRRATLWLRLLGRGPTFVRAVAELAALPHDSLEWRALGPVVAGYRPEILARIGPYGPEEKAVVNWRENVEAIRREGREEGRAEGAAQGRAEGAAQGLLAVWTARFGEPPAAIVAAVERVHDVAVLSSWTMLAATASRDEVERVIRAGVTS
jgi:hypothetical protein